MNDDDLCAELDWMAELARKAGGCLLPEDELEQSKRVGRAVTAAKKRIRSLRTMCDRRKAPPRKGIADEEQENKP